jgi:hypothetical protein
MFIVEKATKYHKIFFEKYQKKVLTKRDICGIIKTS